MTPTHTPARGFAFVRNSEGGLTYASKQRMSGAENRRQSLNDLRLVVDAMIAMAAKVRHDWPERYPIPDDFDAVLKFHDYALERLRSGALKRMGEEFDR